MPLKLVAVNDLVAVIDDPTYPLTVCEVGLMAGGLLIVRLTIDVAEPVVPLAVMVYLVADFATVGVPLITPVLELMVSPADKEGLMVYVTVPVKPVAAKVAVLTKAVLTVPVNVCVVGLNAAAAIAALFKPNNSKINISVVLQNVIRVFINSDPVNLKALLSYC